MQEFQIQGDKSKVSVKCQKLFILNLNEFKKLEFSCKINVSLVRVSTSVLVIQFVEVRHDLYHCLSFGLWDKT